MLYMSKLSSSEIEKVSQLARIELTPNELSDMTIKIGDILNFVDTLQAVETKNIVPTSQVTGLTDVWREDEIVKSKVTPKELLAGAPELLEGYVKVKKVL